MHAQLLSDEVTNPVLQIDHESCCQDRPNLRDCQQGVCPPNPTLNYSRPKWKPTLLFIVGSVLHYYVVL